MVHLLAVRQLMHHDHLDIGKRQPGTTGAAQHELDHFASVEVATNKFAIGGEFLEGHDADVVHAHDRQTLSCDALKKDLRKGFVGRFERFDEDDVRVGLGVARVKALDPEGHGEGEVGLSNGLAYADAGVTRKTNSGPDESKEVVFSTVYF